MKLEINFKPIEVDIENRGDKEPEYLISYKVIALGQGQWDYILTPNLELKPFSQACSCGIEAPLRPMAWKLLLGYLPRNTVWRIPMLISRRAKYKFYCERYTLDSYSMTLSERAIFNQIRKDIPRIDHGPLLLHEKYQNMMTRILYIWAIHHPETTYVQGMNEVLVPFIYMFTFEYLNVYFNRDRGHIFQQYEANEAVATILLTDKMLFEIETDSWGCFSLFMEKIKGLFFGNQLQTIHHTDYMDSLISERDPTFFNHMVQEGISCRDFAFQWIHCIFVREFNISIILRIWDTYISVQHKHDEISILKYHAHVCAYVLLSYRSELLNMKFEEMLIFLKNIPTKSWKVEEVEAVLSQALRSIVNDQC